MRISRRGQITTQKPPRGRGGLLIRKRRRLPGEGVGVDEHIEKVRGNSKTPIKTAVRRSSSC